MHTFLRPNRCCSSGREVYFFLFSFIYIYYFIIFLILSRFEEGPFSHCCMKLSAITIWPSNYYTKTFVKEMFVSSCFIASGFEFQVGRVFCCEISGFFFFFFFFANCFIWTKEGAYMEMVRYSTRLPSWVVVGRNSESEFWVMLHIIFLSFFHPLKIEVALKMTIKFMIDHYWILIQWWF
jgi:hypothetical protein